MKKISLIIPVYNCEKYLPAMAESLLAQDWDNTEFLFSDDGSTDGSSRILTALAVRDLRVKVIFGANGGVSSARNRALEQATGDYIGFVDADDQLSSDYLRTLAEALEESGADMVCCGFDRVYEKSGAADFLPTAGHQRELADRNRMMELLLRPDGYTTVMWNKLFRREALTDPDGTLQRFDESLHIVEDGEYIFRSRVQTALFLPQRLYRYTVRTSGAMYGPVSDRKLTELKARKMIVALTADASPAVQDLAKMKYQKGVRDLMLHGVIDGGYDSIRHLLPELNTYARELFSSPALSKKEKLKYHVYRPLIRLNLRRVSAFLMDKLSGH